MELLLVLAVIVALFSAVLSAMAAVCNSATTGTTQTLVPRHHLGPKANANEGLWGRGSLIATNNRPDFADQVLRTHLATVPARSDRTESCFNRRSIP